MTAVVVRVQNTEPPGRRRACFCATLRARRHRPGVIAQIFLIQPAPPCSAPSLRCCSSACSPPVSVLTTRLSCHRPLVSRTLLWNSETNLQAQNHNRSSHQPPACLAHTLLTHAQWRAGRLHLYSRRASPKHWVPDADGHHAEERRLSAVGGSAWFCPRPPEPAAGCGQRHRRDRRDEGAGHAMPIRRCFMAVTLSARSLCRLAKSQQFILLCSEKAIQIQNSPCYFFLNLYSSIFAYLHVLYLRTI